MQAFFKILLPILVIALLFLTYFHSITAITQDLGRHILMGKIILGTHSVPKTNLLSYTYPDFHFINSHWGSEVLLYWIYTLSGFTGTLIITALCSITAFLLLCWYALKKTSILAISFVSFLSLGVLFERTDVRPESFSMLLFAVFLVILFTNRQKPTKWIYALIPLELLWVNLHIYWAIGIAIIGLFFIDELSPVILNVVKNLFQGKYTRSFVSLRMTNPQIRSLFFVLIMSILLTPFNPNGISGAFYPFHVFDNYGYSIQENQTVFLLWSLFGPAQTILFFWISVLLFFSLMLIRFKHTHLIGWLLGIFFTYLSASAIRNFPLFIFAIFIPFSYHLSVVIKSIEEKSKTYLLLATCCLLLLLWQITYVFQTKPFSITTPTGASKAVDFIQRNNIHGPFFNNFDIGSYFLFRLYPHEKVFVDGRPESYPASFFQQTYIPMQQNSPLFEKLSKKYHFTAIFFSHTDQTPWAKQFLHDIVQNKAWKVVYLDDTVIILTKKSTTLPALPLDKITPVSETIPGLYNYVLFFQTIENLQGIVHTAEKILEKNPNDCVGLSVLSQTNTSTAPIYQTRYRMSCQ